MVDTLQIFQMPSSQIHYKVSAASEHMLYDPSVNHHPPVLIFPSTNWLAFETIESSTAFHASPVPLLPANDQHVLLL
jgi:hypothetical protein